MRKVNDFPVITDIGPEEQNELRLIAIETFRRLTERARIEDGKERTILDVLCDVALRLMSWDPRFPYQLNGRDVDVLLWEALFDEPYDDGVPADLIMHWGTDAGGALMDAFHWFRDRKIQDPPFADVRRVAQYFLTEIDRPKWKPTLEQELEKRLDNRLFRRLIEEAVDKEEADRVPFANALRIYPERFNALVALYLKRKRERDNGSSERSGSRRKKSDSSTHGRRRQENGF